MRDKFINKELKKYFDKHNWWSSNLNDLGGIDMIAEIDDVITGIVIRRCKTLREYYDKNWELNDNGHKILSDLYNSIKKLNLDKNWNYWLVIKSSDNGRVKCKWGLEKLKDYYKY